MTKRDCASHGDLDWTRVASCFHLSSRNALVLLSAVAWT
jgi:hypothetical protein